MVQSKSPFWIPASMNHPALAGHLLPGWDFVDDDGDPSEVGDQQTGPYGHGTHVAGLIARRTRSQNHSG